MARLLILASTVASAVAVAGALTLAVPRPPSPNDDRAVGVRGYGDPRWTFRDVVRTDGGQVSGGALVGNRALVGSPWDRGALLCELDEV